MRLEVRILSEQQSRFLHKYWRDRAVADLAIGKSTACSDFGGQPQGAFEFSVWPLEKARSAEPQKTDFGQGENGNAQSQ